MPQTPPPKVLPLKLPGTAGRSQSSNDALRDPMQRQISGSSSFAASSSVGASSADVSSPGVSSAGEDEVSVQFGGSGGSVKTTLSEICVCGNKFMEDSNFCRSCGLRRPEVSSPEPDRKGGGGVRFSMPEVHDIFERTSSELRTSCDSLEGNKSEGAHSHSIASYFVNQLLPTTEQAQEFSDDDDDGLSRFSSKASVLSQKSLRSIRSRDFETDESRQSAKSDIEEGLTQSHSVRQMWSRMLTRNPSKENDISRLRLATPNSEARRSLLRGTTTHLHAKDLPVVCNDTQFRILDRDGPFGQSNGHWAINNVRCVGKRSSLGKTQSIGSGSSLSTSRNGIPASQSAEDMKAVQELGRIQDKKQSEQAARAAQDLADLHGADFYHAFLDANFSYHLGCFAAAYMACFIGFAVVYLWMSEPCGLELKGDFIRAYLLSLETMTTIGYGVPDPYMKGCSAGPLVLTLQSFIQMLLGALLIGVIFQRISKPQSRANTIVFSEKAVIQQINGVLYFMFRVCDLRIRHALIEPHVRCYCLWKHPDRGYEMVPMRLEHPDDTQGAPLLLTLPAMVVHRIDAWSPLAPHGGLPLRNGGLSRPPSDSNLRRASGSPRFSGKPEIFRQHSSLDRNRDLEYLRTSSWPGPLQRQVDCETGCRNSCVCPTCGASFGTGMMLQLHCRYNAVADKANDIPEEACHQDIQDEEDLRNHTHEDPSRAEVEDYLSKVHIEVVVLIEGIEPTTSATLQARHSYIVGTKHMRDVMDVEWDMEFVECCKVPRDESKGLVIDLTKFHELRKAEHIRHDSDAQEAEFCFGRADDSS